MAPSEGDRHQRLTDLFVRAAFLDEAARVDFLQALQGSDCELRADLESLLAFDDDQDEDDPPPPAVDIG